MTRFTYASAIAPPAPQVAVTSGGSLTASVSGKFYLQKRTRQGFTVYSPFATVSAIAGQMVEVTVPVLARKPADDIQQFVLSFSTTGNYQDACAIAVYPGIDPITKNPSTLPFTFYLSRDEHFAIGKTVATAGSLPSGSDRVHGMRRYLDSESKIVEWDAFSSSWIAASPQAFSTFVENSQSTNGCDRAIGLIEDRSIIIPEPYAAGEPSPPIKFWLVNDTGSVIEKGTPISTIISCPNYKLGYSVLNPEDENRRVAGDISAIIDRMNGATIVFLGYVNTATGAIDTSGEGGIGTMDGIGASYPYRAEPNATVLPKDLSDGFAYTYQISFEFSLSALKLSAGAQLVVSSEFYPFAGQFSVLAKALGNLIAATEKRRRIFPRRGLSAVAASGSGSIEGYSFYRSPTSLVVGLQPNIAYQIVAIAASGFCSVVTSLPDGTAKRSIVSTANGVGQATAWSSTIALDGSQQIQVTVNYPIAIREDYPDAISGDEDGEFNATAVRVYVQSQIDSTIQYWEFAVTPGQSADSFTFGQSAGVAVVSLPTASPDFGLYQVTGFTPTAVTGTSSIAAGDYKVAIALVYTNTVTSISHSPALGCVKEWSDTLENIERFGRVWSDVLRDIELETLPRDAIWDWQIRRVLETGDAYLFNPRSTAGRKPNWLPSDRPGRWELQRPGSWIYVTSTPSNSQGLNGDWAVQASTGDFWYKTGGAWVYQNSLRSQAPALVPRGVWNSATTYTPPDLVTYQGSSFLALQNSLNVAPAPGPYWQVIGSKGDQGDEGIAGGSLGAIATATVTTGTLGPGNVAEVEVAIGILARLRKIETDRGAWVRIYGSAAGRTADAGRLISEDPPRQIGLALDIETETALSQMLQNVWFDNFDSTPGTTAYLSITNLSDATATIAVTLEYIRAA